MENPIFNAKSMEENSGDYIPDSMPIKEVPDKLKPREHFIEVGESKLSDVELLSILLRCGVQNKNVLSLAREILERFDGLGHFNTIKYEELVQAKIRGLGPVKAMEIAAMLELSRRIAQRNIISGVPLSRPSIVYANLKPLADRLSQEVFWVLPLNVKNKLICAPIEISRGTIDCSIVHPRDVFSKALRLSAASVIFAHNHPSGDPTPSKEDIKLTEKLIECGRILDIKVLDHIVIGEKNSQNEGYISFLQEGLVRF